MLQVILVGAGGFAGALCRYFLDRRVASTFGATFPWGTLLINVSGSLVLGILFVLFVERAALPANLRAPLMIGFIGAYTTFSTLMLESLRLIEDGAWLYAIANLGGSVLLGMVAVIIGVGIGRQI